MPQIIKLIVYPVQDLEKGKEFYGKFLDAEPYVEQGLQAPVSRRCGRGLER